jgi:hypothetical protein
MSDHDITHREIYDRLVTVESKVDAIESNTNDMVAAFVAAKGAFTVLEWIAKIAKPFLFLAAVVAAISVFIQDFKSH